MIPIKKTKKPRNAVNKNVSKGKHYYIEALLLKTYFLFAKAKQTIS